MHGSAPHVVVNSILHALPPSELADLWPHLTSVDLPFKTVLLWPDKAIENLHFIESGIVSMITIMSDGSQVEVGMFGHEGVVGLSAFLGAPTSALEALVQVEGRAWRLPVSSLPAALSAAPSLSRLMLRYIDSHHFQVTQTAACNGQHEVEQRLSRWILMSHDRVDGDALPMTHEFMAAMLGVQRPSVSLAVGVLRRAGLVNHERGVMQVLDRPGLEAAACECYELVRKRFAWLTRPLEA
jgi:CRP-like cAMP-binding protein